MTSKNTATSENKYFNLHVNGIGYLSNIRQVNGPKGQFLTDRKSTRLNSSHEIPSRMPSSA